VAERRGKGRSTELGAPVRCGQLVTIERAMSKGDNVGKHEAFGSERKAVHLVNKMGWVNLIFLGHSSNFLEKFVTLFLIS